MRASILSGLTWDGLEHAVRTTVAATLSLAVAQAFHFPEAQWAAISTMVVTQSSLGAAFTISSERFVGTAVGAFTGAFLATRLGSGLWAFAAGIFLLGVVCAASHLDRAAYRFAGIALAITLLVARSEPAWMIAFHRFFEVSLGIAVGLLMTWLWPERNQARPRR
jgi:uncharacterized membrane protein YgaE (UPF0421/DUF939 family)